LSSLIDLEAEMNLVCRRPNRVLGRQRRGMETIGVTPANRRVR